MRRRPHLPTPIATLFLVGTLAVVPATTFAQAASSPAGPSPVAASSVGAATPEEAVGTYLGAVAANDVEAILAATAVDEMAAAFDFAASSERLRAMNLGFSLAPSEYAMYAEMNRYQQAAQILAQVRNLAYGLLSEETIDGSIIVPVDEAQIAAFVAAVDPSRLAGLAVIDVRLPEPEAATDERYLEMVARIAATYGADEMVERLAFVELDGESYGVGFTLLRYGDAWLVSTQGSVLGGTSLLGTAEPMTREEFDDRTS